MQFLTRTTSALVVLIAVAAFCSRAEAQVERRVLDQTALIKSAIECKPPCADPPEHFHEAFGDWEIEPGKTTFEVNEKLKQSRPSFFDRPWNFWNDMQKPDLHLINRDKYPLSLENFGGADRFNAALTQQPGAEEALVENTAWPIKLEDFLFAFTIHMLKNSDKSTTPHAILYVPLRWNLSLPKDLGDFFVLFVFHIPDDDRDCSYEGTEIGKKHCLLLRRLAGKWIDPQFDYEELSEEARREYRYFLDHIFDGILPPSDAALVKGFQVGLIRQWIAQILLHNGIIHGTLGGG
jgi:hypothetical protein